MPGQVLSAKNTTLNKTEVSAGRKPTLTAFFSLLGVSFSTRLMNQDWRKERRGQPASTGQCTLSQVPTHILSSPLFSNRTSISELFLKAFLSLSIYTRSKWWGPSIPWEGRTLPSISEVDGGGRERKPEVSDWILSWRSDGKKKKITVS